MYFMRHDFPVGIYEFTVLRLRMGSRQIKMSFSSIMCVLTLYAILKEIVIVHAVAAFATIAIKRQTHTTTPFGKQVHFASTSNNFSTLFIEHVQFILHLMAQWWNCSPSHFEPLVRSQMKRLIKMFESIYTPSAVLRNKTDRYSLGAVE